MSTTQLGQEEAVMGSRCQDCGNQAKKDCTYSRCRSCCKNKGFECQTHIRSTWIPVDRRRQRILEQQQQPPPTTSNLHHTPKRNKQNPFPSLEELKFPVVMSSMATFSCFRVRSMDETVNEVAYQTSVKIGGHVFSGLLYDQGPDHEQSFNNIARGTEISTINSLDHQQHNLNLFTRDDGATATMAPLSSHELLFPPPPHPLANSFRPGMPYFSHPKP